jgi:predicted ATPase/DNA-binding SARP family transcriptional activator
MLEARLLGQFEVELDGKRLTIPSRKAQSLFAYLVINAGKAHRRERLAGLLWPDSLEDTARSNLRHELWRLRKAFQGGSDPYILTDDLTITFDAKSEYVLDVFNLESIAPDASTKDELVKALSVYQGELLPGFYEEWVFLERSRLSGIFEAKISRLLDILQSESQWTEVLEWGMRWVTLSLWPEPAYRALMTAYANTGDLSKAVTTYEHFVQGLQKDLGLKPSEQTQALNKRIKNGWKQEGNTDTTVHLNQPANMAVKAVSTTYPLPKVRRSNLPKPMTNFIGREKEIEQVAGLITTTRLVTITGPGGVGKTRLAIQVAGKLVPQFRDGAWWIELAALSMPNIPLKREYGVSELRRGEYGEADPLAQVISKALRIPETPSLSPMEEVIEYLTEKEILIVLDNCEHLVEACAILVSRLISECPNVNILATSREMLGVPGERSWLLPPLSLAGKEASDDRMNNTQSEAVTLFIARTTDVFPGFKPSELDLSIIARICLRLDGIPLAIELAAARMNLLSPQEIATRLDRRFSLLTGGQRMALPRHQTMLAAIEWSYALLSQSEQILFRRLSIFTGSFTLEAAEAICSGEGISDDEVLTLIGRLLGKSLLTVEPAVQYGKMATRYRLLDTIRRYGLIKLDDANETFQLNTRHADYYVHLVEATAPRLFLPNQAYWYKFLQVEYVNIRAVIEWSIESDQPESALRIVGTFFWFWVLLGFREGLDLASRALDLPSSHQLGEFRGRALNTLEVQPKTRF